MEKHTCPKHKDSFEDFCYIDNGYYVIQTDNSGYPVQIDYCPWCGQCLTPLALDLPNEPVNYCVPVNGVHAPFCTGHKSASQ